MSSYSVTIAVVVRNANYLCGRIKYVVGVVDDVEMSREWWCSRSCRKVAKVDGALSLAARAAAVGNERR